MKIQEFCSKIHEDKDGIFQVLRELRRIDNRTLTDDGDWLTWDPWAALATAESVSA